MQSVDVGFTHVAFTVRCLASSIDFYTRYTAMTVIHQREPDLPSARKVALARREGVLRREPEQLGDPVGYFAFFADPDGNTLELSWGQRVGLEVILAGKPGE